MRREARMQVRLPLIQEDKEAWFSNAPRREKLASRSIVRVSRSGGELNED